MNNDDIRQPDSVKIEQLIHNNNDDLNTVLEISKNEYKLFQDEEEQKAIETICNQIKEQHHKEKQNKFNNVKIKLNKIILLDKNNLDYYELVLSIIEMYELGIIPEYKTHTDEYNNIFKLLQTIRIPTDEMDNLKKIIVCEEE